MKAGQLSKALILLSYVLSSFLLFFHPTVFAGNRGLNVGGKGQEAETSQYYRKSWAVIIGIDKYNHWPQLEYAVHDAKGMKETLKKFGFTEFLELYDNEATKPNIMRLLGDELGNPDKVDVEDRVVVFFAGHGQTRQLPSGNSLGYIIPVEADFENYHSKAISMTNLRDFCELIPAKHLLFIMDSCYSGLALSTRGAAPNSKTRNYVSEITRRRARQIITAGGADEEVADGGPNNHSIFTGYLIRSLEERLADVDGNGVITVSEIAAFITPQVRSYSNQTPAWGNLLGSEGGDMVFQVPQNSTMSDEKAEQNSYLAAKKSNTIEGWEAFINQYPDSRYAEDARLSIQILRSEQTAAELAEKARLEKEMENKRIYLQQLEDKAFKNARDVNTTSAWTTYLNNYPDLNSDHVNFAKRQIELLKRPQKVAKTPTPVPEKHSRKTVFSLFHDQPAFGFGGKKKEIEVEIEGNARMVKNAILYYSSGNTSSFRNVNMDKSRSSLVGYIPKQAMNPDKVVYYYIVVIDVNGKVHTVGTKNNPKSFKVKKGSKSSVAPVINF